MNIVILMTDQQAHPFLGCAGYPGLKTRVADLLNLSVCSKRRINGSGNDEQ